MCVAQNFTTRGVTMQSWDLITLGLLALGYRQIHFIEIECTEHGAFRAGVEQLLETFACPRCGKSEEAAYLARGFTRKPTIWECVSRPLSAGAKRRNWAEAVSPSKPKREYRAAFTRRPPNPETEHRIVLAAFLALRGATRQAMAEQIGVKAGAVFYCRNKTAIEREQERLRLLPEDARRYEVERARLRLGGRVSTHPQNFAAAQHSACIQWASLSSLSRVMFMGADFYG